MSLTMNDNSAFLKFDVFSLLFYLTGLLFSCPHCKLNTLWNIFMILGRNVDQVETTCCVQEGLLWRFYFWSYLVLFVNMISCPLFNSNTHWHILMVFGRNE